MTTLTEKRLREVLDYDPGTGVFRWKKRTGSRAVVGAVAGTINRDGYVQIQIDGRLYYGHRLAWLWMTGEFPEAEIDHESIKPADNRWSQIRAATRSENEQNKRRRIDNSSGFKCVYRRPGGTFYAQIKRNGRTVCLGSFPTAEEAHQAYSAAAEKLFGRFARVA